MKLRIEPGDTIDVDFLTLPTEYGVKVLYVPGSIGESWCLQRRDGTLIYINTFAKMVLNKGEQK